MPEVKALHAVVLVVRDLDAQRRFYTEMLGFKVDADYGDAVFLSCGSQKLALFAHGHHPQAEERLDGARHGISHFEFAIDGADEPAFVERLTTAGFHAYRDSFQDADGNLFHFVYG
jgi:catechol 2,3-dioxygenase-like lactoylglutathione lyase family enzyme